eukprot:TRINITY_DN135_c0_g1_i13.p1 TRINITY_DN135_c0_g1~~TRINITY_DN135_c0_g1_i13.p1  ORF type:complete len:912 (+),score=104.78 TRINITY_DN135_c0_g1_i13:1851-4586(+)
MVNKDSRMVYTTRDRGFIRGADKVIEFKEKEPFGELSKRMLMKHADFGENTLLRGKNLEAFNKFLELCQGLPLGFGIVGGSVRVYSYECENKQDAWSEFYNDIAWKRENLMESETVEYGKLSKIEDISIEVLKKRNGDEKFEKCFEGFCVIQKQQSVPLGILQALWNFQSLEEAARVVKMFADVSVVQMSRNDGSVYVRLHDLVLDIATRRARNGNRTAMYFRELHHNYFSRHANQTSVQRKSLPINLVNPIGWLIQKLPGAMIGKWSQKCARCVRDGLYTTLRQECVELRTRVSQITRASRMSDDTHHAPWKIEDHEYFLSNMCRILRYGGQANELLSLLSQPLWVSMRLLRDGILGFLHDLEYGKAILEDKCIECEDRKQHLENIGGAARLSATFINENPCEAEVWFQIHGRLQWLATQNKLTREFVNRMERDPPKPWLRASAGLLEQAGNTTLEVIYGPNTRGKLLIGALTFTQEESDIRVLWKSLFHNELHVSTRTQRKCIYRELNNDVRTIGYVLCASFLEGGRRVATAHADGRIFVWCTQTGMCEQTAELCKCHEDGRFIGFSADGAQVACEMKDHSIEVWNTLRGNRIGQSLHGHTRRVSCVEMSADGTQIVSGSWDKTIRVWDMWTGNDVVPPLKGHTSIVTCVAVSADGARIVSGSFDKTVRVWDARSGNAMGEPLRGHSEVVCCVALSADGTCIASGSGDNTVRVWNTRGGEAVGQPLRGHTDCVDSVTVSTDGIRVMSGSCDHMVRVGDVHDDKVQRQSVQGDTDKMTCVAVSADGTRIVSGSTDRMVYVWDAHTGNALGSPLQGHTDVVQCVVVSVDGTRIVSGSRDKTVRVWDAHTGNAVGQPLEGHADWVSCVAVSADGTCIVSGSKDCTVRVAHTGSGTHTLAALWDSRSKVTHFS